MRKVSVIVSVCLVCLTLCLCIPFDGNAYSLNGEAPRYACLQFDSFETPYYSFPYPFNSASDRVNRASFVFNDISDGFISSDGNSIFGYLNGLGGSWIELYSSSQLVRMNDLAKKRSFIVYPGQTTMTFHYADISVDVLHLNVVSNSDRVNAFADSLSMRVWCGDDGSLNIGPCLYNLLYTNGYDDTFVLLSDLSINIAYSITDLDTPSIMLDCVTNTYDPNLFMQQWVGDQEVSVNYSDAPSSDFNLGTWLADTVQGFLKAEIFPGLSFDSIFYAILVIGVLLWFINVMS